MAIKFQCMHCNKTLTVKDELAGRKGRCPMCKNEITVPTPIAAPADVEAFAAAALAEQPAEQVVKEVGTITFQCPMCDEKVTVSADLAGKQAPCPECRRIVKVPLPQTTGPKDWRKVDKVPSLARRDDPPAPEGAWGTATTEAVSREAMEEAGVIVEPRVPLTLRQKANRVTLAVVAVLIIVPGTWAIYHFVGTNRQNRIIARAAAVADGDQVKAPETAAELNRALGEYYAAAGKAVLANNRFKKARTLLAGITSESGERELLLADLALAQLELGGEKNDIMDGKRISWNDVARELRQTLQNIRVPEARSTALHEVSRKLIARGQIGLATTLVSQLSPEEPAEAGAIVGQEQFLAKQTQQAEALADQALQHYTAAVPQPNAVKPAPSASLLALYLALNKPNQVALLLPPAKEKDDEPNPAVRAGYAAGAALKGDLNAARNYAQQKPGSPQARLEALLAAAEAAVAAGQAEAARPLVQDALDMLEKERWEKPIPWLLWRVARAAAQTGLTEAAEKPAKVIQETGLRGRALLEILRAKLAGSKEKMDDTLAQALKDTPAHGAAVTAVARHNTRYGSGGDARSAADGLEPEWLRGFAYAGVGLGLQDNGR